MIEGIWAQAEGEFQKDPSKFKTKVVREGITTRFIKTGKRIYQIGAIIGSGLTSIVTELLTKEGEVFAGKITAGKTENEFPHDINFKNLAAAMTQREDQNKIIRNMEPVIEALKQLCEARNPEVKSDDVVEKLRTLKV